MTADLSAMGVCVCIYIYIIIHGGFRDLITAASMKKNRLWRFYAVVELSEIMGIGQDQSQLNFDRCIHKLGNGGLQITELVDSIHISAENLYEIQDDTGIAIRESLRHIVEKIFSDINGNFHTPEQQWFLG